MPSSNDGWSDRSNTAKGGTSRVLRDERLLTRYFYLDGNAGDTSYVVLLNFTWRLWMILSRNARLLMVTSVTVSMTVSIVKLFVLVCVRISWFCGGAW